MKQEGPYLGVFRKTPENRNKGIAFSNEDWLNSKRTEDGAEGLWRIHNKIYDFTNFMNTHPGGKYWLDITKGTDITEAFESHHITNKAEALLGKYYVRNAKSPRNSLITFHQNGFYKTLRRKIQNSSKVPVTGSTWQTRALIDTFLVAFFITTVLGVTQSYYWSAVSGIFLYMLTTAAHNFFHMKDNIRMYYFNFSLMSFKDWRISHALSHHQFANTILDLEISLFEPIFKYLPLTDKTILESYLSWVISPIIFSSGFHLEFFKRCIMVIQGRKVFQWEDFLAFTVPLFTFFITKADIINILISWNITLVIGSFTFILIGLTAAHHHPDIYHEGDFLGNDKDFGILQLAAVRDREEINGNIFLTLITFGDHTLHHLFPTLDHMKLPSLDEYLCETCREFNIDYKLTTFSSLVTGMYRQLKRNYLNGKLFIQKNKSN